MFNDKTLDITLEEGASLAYSLKLESETEVCVPHPLTGEETNCTIVPVATDISATTFTGSIISGFGGTSLADFTFVKQGTGELGIVQLSLSKEEIQSIANLVRGYTQVLGNPRLRDVGFYTVTYNTGESQTRLMEGRVTMSLGV